MLYVELPNGTHLDFDSPEALARAVAQMRAGTPIMVMSEQTGEKQVVWAPGDAD
jgi:hypothetical protein